MQGGLASLKSLTAIAGYDNASHREFASMRARTVGIAIFARVYLAASMGLFAVVFSSQTSEVGAPDSRFVATWLLLYVLTGFFAFRYRANVSTSDALVLSFAIFLATSYFWSGQPRQTLLYSISFCANIIFILTLRSVFSIDQVIEISLKTILIMCVFGLVANNIGYDVTRYVDIHDRLTFIGTEPIRGFFNHKITAGLYSVVGIIICYHMWHGWKRLVGINILFVFLLLTGSASAVGLLLIWLLCSACISISLRARLSPAVFICSFLIAVSLIALASGLFMQEVLILLDRDPTLTGRTLLWSWGLNVGLDRPILGWGYFGYLGSEAAQEYARSIASFQTYEVPHFHNSYIQMFVDLGLVGLTIGITIPLAIVWRAYREALRDVNKLARLKLEIGLLLLLAAFFIHVFYKYNDFIAIIVMILFLMRGKVNELSVRSLGR